MATFGELKTLVAEKLKRSDLTSQIATAINSTINEFNEKTHFWFNEANSTITLTAGDAVVPNVPSDFLYERSLFIDYSSSKFSLEKIGTDEYDNGDVSGSGLPRWYTFRGDQFEVYTKPDQAYSLVLRYIKSYADLVDDTDTNDWTTNASRLIQYKTLADMYIDYRHSTEMTAIYEAKFGQELAAIQKLNRRKIGTGGLIIENLGYQAGNEFNNIGDY